MVKKDGGERGREERERMTDQGTQPTLTCKMMFNSFVTFSTRLGSNVSSSCTM